MYEQQVAYMASEFLKITGNIQPYQNSIWVLERAQNSASAWTSQLYAKIIFPFATNKPNVFKTC